MLTVIIRLRAQLAEALSLLRATKAKLHEIQLELARGTAINASSLSGIAGKLEAVEQTIAEADKTLTT